MEWEPVSSAGRPRTLSTDEKIDVVLHLIGPNKLPLAARRLAPPDARLYGGEAVISTRKDCSVTVVVVVGMSSRIHNGRVSHTDTGVPVVDPLTVYAVPRLV